jgi:hypothetical protein
LASAHADPSLNLTADGKLFRQQAFGYQKVRDRVIRVGWRHTFERLLQRNLPGITRDTLAREFGVDMLKFPVGIPDEVIADLVAE